MSGFHEYDITADVHGTRTVFANVEWREKNPPDELVIAGVRFERATMESDDDSRGGDSH